MGDLRSGRQAVHDPQDIVRAATDAREAGVSFVLCNPCFEVWLYLHLAERSASFGSQAKAIEALRRLHPAFAEYDTRNGNRKRLTQQRLTALFEGDNLAQACARGRKLHESCENSNCDHVLKPGQSCRIEHRDPSSPLHELFALLGLDVIAVDEA